METLPHKKIRARSFKDESGQALIAVALVMTALIAFLGLAVDVGQLRLAKRNLQGAADAAALAAGLEIRVCGTTPNCAAMQAAALQSMSENGYTGTALVQDCGAVGGSGTTLQLNNPACSLGITNPNYGNNKYVEAIVSQQVSTYFASVLGFGKVTIRARAEAKRNPNGPCIYALNPHADGAITSLVALIVHSNCGIVDESDSPTALYCGAGLLISAPSINVKGGASGLLDGLLCGSSPPPNTGVPVPTPPDPLFYLPTPAHAGDSCASQPTPSGKTFTGSKSQVFIGPLSLLAGGGNFTFNPGVYCGGITITANLLTNVTFNPGTYILKDGPNAGLLGLPLLGGTLTTGGLSITASGLLSSVTGKGVTFYNMSTTSGISIAPANLNLMPVVQLGAFNLSAPTSGTYGGVLFWQTTPAPSTFLINLLSVSILGGGNTNAFQGAIYMPQAPVSYGVNALSTDYNILVANKINLLAGVISNFGNNYDTLQSGSPLGGDNAVLVQ